ncbi:MAG: ATP-binding protein [Lachnospiraceae bacterium]|nr:ATP-binding protein [Lachnospiraceae bacterium]
MGKVFNVNGACMPDRHYMVDLKQRLEEIKVMIDEGQYFTINKARQYGKTTTLRALADFLQKDYVVISLDFQKLEADEFISGSTFVHAVTREVNRKIRVMKGVPDEVKSKLKKLADSTNRNVRMAEMFDCFNEWCEQSEKPIVLMIDEVDTATNNQVFLDFLAQLRADYLDRDVVQTFQSVILASLYDVRNIRRKLRQEDDHKMNSPWNIAADFLVDMNFSVSDIAGMLAEYEVDNRTGMNINEMSNLLYDYTSGYPYLVSRLCKFMDERIAGRPVEAVV